MINVNPLLGRKREKKKIAVVVDKVNEASLEKEL
jgi:hypothetical protein